MKSLGEIVRQRRLGKNLTLDQLAILIDSSKSYLSKLENNHIEKPKPSTLRKIAKQLDMEYNELVMHSNYVDKDTMSWKLPSATYYEIDSILEDKKNIIMVQGKILEKGEREKLLKMVQLLFDWSKFGSSLL
ncbi:helix-turn-helix domain-containing protein [Paracerasibacillus soli]|uniref:Helix-turn-helix transcriptional regulator n=1 Tax=Paracerasibacillus soli TaxID=480284 RepID=A0ABU5CTR9_9BACI|nr:helix-turn-helix transcriptional regulator [Virgibacillus soli]MDY0409734.1 helix-turn-helix transcriptional regulator [Virgibacillus soli]